MIECSPSTVHLLVPEAGTLLPICQCWPVLLPLTELTDRVLATAPRCGDTRLVLVEGRSGAGKTTLSAVLGERLGAPVVHMDEIYPGWDGLAASALLLHRDVVVPLARGGNARYRRWDWARDEPGEEVVLAPPPVLVVEGAGCGARIVAAHAVLLLWIDAPRDERFRRGIARDGETYRPHWERWAAQEDGHHAAERTRSRADVRLDGAPPVEPPEGCLAVTRPSAPPTWSASGCR
jgi:uridine kinase